MRRRRGTTTTTTTTNMVGGELSLIPLFRNEVPSACVVGHHLTQLHQLQHQVQLVLMLVINHFEELDYVGVVEHLYQGYLATDTTAAVKAAFVAAAAIGRIKTGSNLALTPALAKAVALVLD